MEKEVDKIKKTANRTGDDDGDTCVKTPPPQLPCIIRSAVKDPLLYVSLLLYSSSIYFIFMKYSLHFWRRS